MKRFLIQSALFVGLMLGLISLVLFQADGYTDAFYLKFTSPLQSNLILGTSKAAQGIQPRVLEEATGKAFFNYAFTEIHSPFGPAYLRSIKRKIKAAESQGMFLLSIDPWSISTASDDPNDSTQFRELGLALDNTHFVNLSPNFPYLIENLSGEYYTILSQRNPEFFLHQDGWLEVKLSRNQSEIDQRRKEKLAYHRKNSLPYYKFSSLRFSYLQKTIDFLQAHGKVYLIRLPIHPEMMALEEEMMPDFQAKVDLLIPEVDAYLDLTEFNSEYTYIDGTHLDVSSSTKMSKEIANWIKATYDE
ncbi:MAG: hypothetical protein AAGD28_12075 [Bacteroidota bacterium]